MHKDKWASFSLGLLFVIACILTAAGAKADIRAVERNGLSTKVNGKKGGRCDSGVCRISGGKKAGRNKFLKLREFDTRGRIKGVEIETSGTKNVVLGVTSPVGTYINKGIELSSKANLSGFSWRYLLRFRSWVCQCPEAEFEHSSIAEIWRGSIRFARE